MAFSSVIFVSLCNNLRKTVPRANFYGHQISPDALITRRRCIFDTGYLMDLSGFCLWFRFVSPLPYRSPR